MKHRLALLRATFLLGFGASSAHATSLTTWVSATGTDSGACLITAPCASFQYAHNQATAGGTIIVMTAGSYGSISITKSISILAPDGIQAIVNVAAHSQGVTINSSSASVIVLRGITINGPGTTGGNLDNNSGIAVGSAFTGHLTIDHVIITNSAFGAYLASNAFVLINACIIENGFIGILLQDDAVYMGKTTVSGNQEGLSTFESVNYTLNSYGDNILNGNATHDLDEVTINEVPHDQ